MNQLSEKQLSFDCVMKIVNKQKWIQIKDIERLEKFIQNQQATINRLQRKCFELEKDYLIETSDISDKIYLEDEIKKLKKEYGVIDDE